MQMVAAKVGDFVVIDTLLLGDVVLMIVSHTRSGWTIMADDGSTALHRHLPSGTRAATESEIAEWKRRYAGRNALK